MSSLLSELLSCQKGRDLESVYNEQHLFDRRFAWFLNLLGSGLRGPEANQRDACRSFVLLGRDYLIALRIQILLFVL